MKLFLVPGSYFPHVYSGENLEPYADLANAFLKQAFLDYADLTGSNLAAAMYWEGANWTNA